MSAIESRACLQGSTVRRDTLITKRGGPLHQVEIRKTDFKYPYLARWRPSPADPANESAWAAATNLLVTFRGNVDAESAQSVIESVFQSENLSTDFDLAPLPLRNLFLLKTSPAFGGIPADGRARYFLAGLSALAEHPDVLRVTPDFLHFSFSVPRDSSATPMGATTADLDRMGIQKAWKRVTGSKNVRVAVLDTGVAAGHRALKNNILRHNGKVVGYNFYSDTDNPEDNNKHGTFCAGLIGGKGIGVNQDVSIMPVKFLSAGGCGCLSDAICGIEFAIQHKARVISSSWGSISHSQELEDKIAEAGTHGILFIAGAGNENRDIDQAPHFFPAAHTLANVISVGATADDDTAVMTMGHGKSRVLLSAPGVTVFSSVLNNAFGEDNGTSAATAYVAGACALLMAEFPKWKAARIRHRILTGATPLAAVPNPTASCTNRKLDLANSVFGTKLHPVKSC